MAGARVLLQEAEMWYVCMICTAVHEGNCPNGHSYDAPVTYQTKSEAACAAYGIVLNKEGHDGQAGLGTGAVGN